MINDASGPVLSLTNNRSGDGQDNDQAGRIEFRSKDDGTPTEFITAQLFANVALHPQVVKMDCGLTSHVKPDIDK